MPNESCRRPDLRIFNIETKEDKRKKTVHNKFERVDSKHKLALVLKTLFESENLENLWDKLVV